MLVPFAVVERSVAELVGETDVETLSAEQVVEVARKYLSTKSYVIAVAGPGDRD